MVVVLEQRFAGAPFPRSTSGGNSPTSVCWSENTGKHYRGIIVKQSVNKICARQIVISKVKSNKLSKEIAATCSIKAEEKSKVAFIFLLSYLSAPAST